MPANVRRMPNPRSKPPDSVLPERFTSCSISPQNQEVLIQVASLIRLAEGFRLGFVKCNQPIQCRQLADQLKEMLAGEVKIIDVELKAQVPSLRAAVLDEVRHERSTEEGKHAIMVFGFEHSVPAQGPAPALDELNQSRDLFPKEFSVPILIWLPDYTLTRLAREAPDFWGWRSGVFEFKPDLEMIAFAEKTALQGAGTSSLSLEEKKERVAALEGLIRDYQELELGERENYAFSVVLQTLGFLRHQLGEYEEARKLYELSLKIDQDLKDKSGASSSLHQLGILAEETGNYEEARKLYEQSLKINQDLGDKSRVSASLHQLGMLAEETGNYEEARKLYEQGLRINQDLGDRSGVSKSLHQLGNLAFHAGNYEEARKLYEQSLKIKQDLGDKSGVSSSLHQLGILAEETGNYEEARKLYEQSLKINQDLGDKSRVSASLHQLGLLAEEIGNYEEAQKLYEQSLKINQDLGDRSGVSKSLHQLGNLAFHAGNYEEARKLYEQSLKINQDLGDKKGVAFSLAQLGLLEWKQGNTISAIYLTRMAEDILKMMGVPHLVEKARKQIERLEQKE